MNWTETRDDVLWESDLGIGRKEMKCSGWGYEAIDGYLGLQVTHSKSLGRTEGHLVTNNRGKWPQDRVMNQMEMT
jgi:hypothetical protein